MRIHVLGASGAGTTTLGIALAEKLDVPFYDSDDYFWLPTDPPYNVKRPVPERVRLLKENLAQHNRWVLSGSLVGWSEEIESLFTHIIFVSLDQEIRLQRIAHREWLRYGARIEAGGDMFEQSKEFLAYAARYESGDMDIRTRARHEQWMGRFAWPVLRLDSLQPVQDLVSESMEWLARNPSDCAPS
jgi:adenylate kinase family enzyme